MGFLPGWGSVDSTATIAHSLHIAAIVVLGLLFVAEGMALVYDSRNHTLAGIAEQNREAAQKAKDDNAEVRRQAEVKGLQKELEEANKNVTELRKGVTARTLTADQKKKLIAALNPFPGQKVEVSTVLGSDDGLSFANDFVDVFRAAKWIVDPGSPSQGVYSKTPIGLEPTINQAEAQTGHVPPAFVALIQALVTIGLSSSPEGFVNARTAVGTIEMRIGIRPTSSAK